MDLEVGSEWCNTSDKGAAVAGYFVVGSWDWELGIGELGGLRVYLP